MFRLRASYFPVMESSQRSPGLRPRTPGEPFGREAWWEIDRRGCRLVVVLLSPPAAALRWSLFAFCFPCLAARLAWQQSRGTAVNSLPLGEGGSASAETDEGKTRGLCLSYVETAHLSIVFPSSAPSGHLPYPFCPFGTFPPDRGNRPQGKAGGIGFPPPGENQKRGPKPPLLSFQGCGVWGEGKSKSPLPNGVLVPLPLLAKELASADAKLLAPRRERNTPRPQTRNPKLQKADPQPSFKISVRSISCASPHRRSRS